MPPALLPRVRAAVRRYPLLADAVLAAALLMPSSVGVIIHTGVDGVSWLAQVLVVAPLTWRRTAPTLVFGITLVLPFLVVAVTAQPPGAEIPILVALYTVAAHEPTRRVIACAAVVEIGAVIAAVWYSMPSGPVVPALILSSGVVTAAAVIGTNLRTRRAYLAALEDRAARLEREHDQQARIAVADERTRIAREMHDIVAHNLSVMIALADGAVFANRADPAHGEAVMAQVSETGRQALDDMRRVLGVLRADDPAAALTPLPTIDDLDELLTRIRAAGLLARLTMTGDRFPIPAAAQLAIYRMVQEGLTNTLKHATASAADVRLRFGPGRTVEIVISNDGVNRSNGSGTSGHGLAGMRERAALFGGTIEAGPTADGGWQVRAHLRTDSTSPTPVAPDSTSAVAPDSTSAVAP